MQRCEAENLLIEYGQRMGLKNYTPGTTGNMSIRLDDSILITASGSSNGFLEKDDLVMINFE